MSSDEKLNQMQTELNRIASSLENIEAMMEKHDHILFGKDQNPGIIVDLDRLKEHRKNTEKTAMVVWTTAVGLAVKTIWDLIARHGS